MIKRKFSLLLTSQDHAYIQQGEDKEEERDSGGWRRWWQFPAAFARFWIVSVTFAGGSAERKCERRG